MRPAANDIRRAFQYLFEIRRSSASRLSSRPICLSSWTSLSLHPCGRSLSGFIQFTLLVQCSKTERLLHLMVGAASHRDSKGKARMLIAAGAPHAARLLVHLSFVGSSRLLPDSGQNAMVPRHHADYLPSIFARYIPTAQDWKPLVATLVDSNKHSGVLRPTRWPILDPGGPNHCYRRMHHIAMVQCEQIQVIITYLLQDIMTRRQQVIGHSHLVGHVDIIIDLLLDRTLRQDQPYRSRQDYDAGEDSVLDVRHISTSYP